ncbi:MAG TPA: alpha/beta fold hydrolase [Symbiobacteriaceae bacterium]|nr:alpha/beta fold hydrolase [Symbiobacteriaceae bacterium]
MSTFVLVHGAYHGAWCWEKVIPYLVQHGHCVKAVDLPGHGEDQTPIAQITLQSYVNTTIAAIEAAAEPVILVGHSAGGIVISQVAELCPEKVESLVYLTALVPQSGQSIFSAAMADSASEVPATLVLNEAEGWAFSKDEFIGPVYYTDCSEQDIAAAKARLRVEPLGAAMEPVSITPERFGQVTKYYIECLGDHAISPGYQKQMYTLTPVKEVFSLETSHSPFLSAPKDLAKILRHVAKIGEKSHT